MIRLRRSVVLVSAMVVFTMVVPAAARAQLQVELPQEAAEAFDAMVRSHEQALGERTDDSSTPFMWTGESPDRLMVVRTGEILTETTESPRVPGGMLHVWIAGMFIPEVTGPEVLAVLKDFDQHANWYPDVLESTLGDQTDDTIKGSHQVIRKKVLTAVLNLEYDVTFQQESPTQWSVRSVATRIAEVSNPDETPEIEFPVGNDSGFLWRLNAYWGIEEVEGGVLAECLSLSLSRDIPVGLGWMISPIVQSLPEESLTSLMQATRLAVKGLPD